MKMRVDLVEERGIHVVDLTLGNDLIVHLSIAEANVLAQMLRGMVADAETMGKKNFHKKHKVILCNIAEGLGLKKSEYDVRSCLGGPAVLGEVILHTDKFYLQVGGMTTDQFMYRSAKSRQDYSGGANQWLPVAMLGEDKREELLTILRRFQ